MFSISDGSPLSISVIYTYFICKTDFYRKRIKKCCGKHHNNLYLWKQTIFNLSTIPCFRKMSLTGNVFGHFQWSDTTFLSANWTNLSTIQKSWLAIWANLIAHFSKIVSSFWRLADGQALVSNTDFPRFPCAVGTMCNCGHLLDS